MKIASDFLRDWLTGWHCGESSLIRLAARLIRKKLACSLFCEKVSRQRVFALLPQKSLILWAKSEILRKFPLWGGGNYSTKSKILRSLEQQRVFALLKKCLHFFKSAKTRCRSRPGKIRDFAGFFLDFKLSPQNQRFCFRARKLARISWHGLLWRIKSDSPAAKVRFTALDPLWRIKSDSPCATTFSRKGPLRRWALCGESIRIRLEPLRDHFLAKSCRAAIYPKSRPGSFSRESGRVKAFAE